MLIYKYACKVMHTQCALTQCVVTCNKKAYLSKMDKTVAVLWSQKYLFKIVN